jgi:hypothetical protein
MDNNLVNVDDTTKRLANEYFELAFQEGMMLNKHWDESTEQFYTRCAHLYLTMLLQNNCLHDERYFYKCKRIEYAECKKCRKVWKMTQSNN